MHITSMPTKLQKSDRLHVCTSHSIKDKADVEAKLDSGLIKGHAYSVTGAAKVQVRGKDINLVRIRNPWGQREWNGDWSDK